MRDVYKPRRNGPIVRLELVSTQYALCIIIGLEYTFLSFPLVDRFAHVTVSGKAPLRTTLPNYNPTIDRQFYMCGLDCRMVELANFTDFILPPADQMATTVTDWLSYHLNTTKGRTGLHALHSSLTATRIAASFPTKAAFTTDGPDGDGAIAMGNENTTLTDTRKVVLSLTTPFPSSTLQPSKDPLSTLCATQSTPGFYVSTGSPNTR
jgi:hypothetical protein